MKPTLHARIMYTADAQKLFPRVGTPWVPSSGGLHSN